MQSFCLVGGDNGLAQAVHTCRHRHIKGSARSFIGCDSTAKHSEGGNGGLGGIVFSKAKLHVAAPIVGNARINAKHVHCTPNALLIHAKVCTSDIGASDGGDPRRDFDARGNEAFPKEAVLKLLKDQRAASVDDIKDVDLNACPKTNGGIPIKLRVHIVDQVDARYSEIGDSHRKAPCGDRKLTRCGQRAEQCELTLHHNGKRRQNGSGKDRFVYLIHTSAKSAYPEDTHAIHVDAGGNTAHKEVKLIGNRYAIIGTETKLTLHLEDDEVCRAIQIHSPFLAHHLHFQGALKRRHTLSISRDADVHRGVEADEAAAKEDIVECDGERAVFVRLHLLNVRTVALVHVTDLLCHVGSARKAVLLLIIVPFCLNTLIVGEGRGYQEIGADLSTECDDEFGIALVLLALVEHSAKLRIAEFHDHTRKGLRTRSRAGPTEHDVILVCLAGLDLVVKMLADLIVLC